ncbi:MAG TPA: M81 family metallopeptidase, partial [Kofleriaceae bacterium]
MPRIAFARFAQETNALSPVATTLRDFEASHYLEGDALLAAVAAGREVAGLFRRGELAGFLAAARERRAEI